jgi:hypothetical protein
MTPAHNMEIFINSLYLGDKVLKDLEIFLCFWRKEKNYSKLLLETKTTQLVVITIRLLLN